MTNPVIKKLAAIWQGPAITMKVGDQETLLGQGESTATIIFNNPAIIKNFLKNPSMVFGEGYMNGDITIEGDLINITRGYFLTAPKIDKAVGFKFFRQGDKERINRKQGVANAAHHYNLGNDFYKMWLDPSMAYSCAYYLKDDDDLATAQQQKFDLIAKKVRLEPGQKLLDIGCGWGGFIFNAVEKYGVTATGIVAAKEQGKHVIAEAKRRGLEDKINIIIADWREITGQYDRVVSIGFAEHVGAQQHDEFFRLHQELLADQGIALLHTISRTKILNDSPWIVKYIFPGGYLPTLEQIATHAANNNLVVTDVENLWQHYAKTLHAWAENFQQVREKVIEMYDEEFARMWWLYLQGCEAAFDVGSLQLYQVVMIKDKQSPWPLNREVLTRS